MNWTEREMLAELRGAGASEFKTQEGIDAYFDLINVRFSHPNSSQRVDWRSLDSYRRCDAPDSVSSISDGTKRLALYMPTLVEFIEEIFLRNELVADDEIVFLGDSMDFVLLVTGRFVIEYCHILFSYGQHCFVLPNHGAWCFHYDTFDALSFALAPYEDTPKGRARLERSKRDDPPLRR